MSDAILKQIQASIEQIRFGSVEIVIHDSKVVQIERKEKVRFTNEHSELTGKPEVPNHKKESL